MKDRVDRFLPEYDVSDSVAVTLAAEPAGVWDALTSIDLIELGRRHRVVGVLGALRIAPEMVSDLLHGRGFQPAPEHMTLLDTAESGSWVLLESRRPEWLVLGLVGRFWRPVIEYRPVAAGEFRDFHEPGFAKTMYALSITPVGEGKVMLKGEMRTATNDEVSRRRFRRYWTFGVGSGAHVLVQALLDEVRESVEEVEPTP